MQPGPLDAFRPESFSYSLETNYITYKIIDKRCYTCYVFMLGCAHGCTKPEEVTCSIPNRNILGGHHATCYGSDAGLVHFGSSLWRHVRTEQGGLLLGRVRTYVHEQRRSQPHRRLRHGADGRLERHRGQPLLRMQHDGRLASPAHHGERLRGLLVLLRLQRLLRSRVRRRHTRRRERWTRCGRQLR